MSTDANLRLAQGLLTFTRKRKIRKGTQSCWECKRRKTRCIFAAPVDTTCVGCKSRETTCLSQEFCEDVSAIPKKVTRTTRLASASARSLLHRIDKERPTVSRPDKPGLPQTEALPPSKTYHNVYCALAAVWPCDRDLSLICDVTSKDFSILHSPLNSPHSNLEDQHHVSPKEVLELPSYGAHPVLVARKLLLLSAFLRRFLPENSTGTPGLDGMADRLLNASTTLVTTNDELLQSIEGIECVTLESMVHNYRGNLRRALLSLRKAMVLAQLLGLHRQTHSVSLKVIEPQTRARIDFDYIWFRLVESDRYLSLMLGVPQSWSGNAFLEMRELRLCSPIEQFERLLIVISGRILDRNERDVQDLAVTQEIDHLLQCASTYMPPQWWTVPRDSPGSVNPMWTSQIMLQLTHYFLVTQLHFPYLLDSSDSHMHTYSKITAVNASRDILFRFLALRDDATMTYYCRGVDLIAFFASAALCLAHIAGSQGYETPFESMNGNKAFSYLIHQRVSDRGLVERTLEHMERTARSSDDPIASRLVELLHPLLMMESASRTGAIITADFTPDGCSEDSECSGKVSDGGNALHIFIPHCGKVGVTRTMFDDDSLAFDSRFNTDGECIDTMWVSEATPGAGAEILECSDLVGEESHSTTHG
jgi:hypothetical protein